MVDQLRPLSPAGRRRRAGQPHRRQQGLGRGPGLQRRWRDPVLPRDEAPRLRGRPLRDHGDGRGQRRKPRDRAGLGPFAKQPQAGGGRQDAVRGRAEHGRVPPVPRRPGQRRSHRAGGRRYGLGLRHRRRHHRADPQHDRQRRHPVRRAGRWRAAAPDHADRGRAPARSGVRRLRAVLVQGRGRRHRAWIRGQAFGLRAGSQVPRCVPDPRWSAGQLRERLELPLEPADLRRPGAGGGDDRLPRLDRLRPGLHRRD